jgi:Bacterial cellulose synthase subunit
MRTFVALAAAALLLAGACAGTAGAAGARVEPLTLTLADSGYWQHLDLRGAATARRLEIAVPERWRSASGELRLWVRGSRKLVAGSSLEVVAGGRVIARAPVQRRRSAVIARLPRLPVRDGSLEIELRTRVRTARAVCPAIEDAAVRIGSDSTLSLRGLRDTGTPMLSELPNALIERHGSWAAPLTVRFTGAPTPAAVRAAGVAAGWIARAAGDPGIDVRVASRDEDAVAGWPELDVNPRGRGRLSVVQRRDGGITVRIGGAGEGLLRAAWALRPRSADTLRGRSTWQPPPIAVPAKRTLPSRLPIAPQRLDAAAPQFFELDVPAWIELQRATRLELVMSRAATAGRTPRAFVNGIPLVTAENEPAPGHRPVPGSPREALASIADDGPPEKAEELSAGKNFLGLRLRPDRSYGCVANVVDLGGGSGLDIRPHWRKPTADLGLWPFPLDARPGWRDADVVLPERPTNEQLGATIGALAAAARASDWPSLAHVRFGSPLSPPRRDGLVLVDRPADVPAWARRGLAHPPVLGTLAALRVDGHTAFLAVGARALRLTGGPYALGSLRGQAMVVDAQGKARVVAGSLARPTAIEWREVPFKVPFATLLAGLALLAVMSLRAAVRRVSGGLGNAGRS